MASIHPLTISVTGATGGAGAATATTTSTEVVNGIIRAVYLAYVGSPPAGTTDVTIATAGTPSVTILTIANAATDGWFYPMAQSVLNTSGAAITNQGAPVVVNDKIVATIAQANDADGVTVTILYEQ